MKLKLKPSARVNRRYILIEAESESQVAQAVLDGIGVIGWAKSSPIFIKSKNSKIILSIDRKELNNVRAAIELSRENIRILRVSGTINGLADRNL
jgi:RNase P/RNase MRP subunit POP5